MLFFISFSPNDFFTHTFKVSNFITSFTLFPHFQEASCPLRPTHLLSPEQSLQSGRLQEEQDNMSMFTQTTTGRVDQLGSLSQSQKHKTHKHTKYKHTAQSHTQGPGGAQKLEQRVGRRSPWWSWPHWGSSSARRPGRKRGLVKVTKALNTTYFENMNDTATCCPRCSKSLSMEAKPLAAV